ncbi:MAG: GtrA family protein [Bacteroidales bacterium]|jgi:putative flippase GtrA|nr:GtrA family protein [Bacteroidales bacterium]
MGRSWKELLGKFVMFVLTSSLGTVVDLGLHWVLSTYAFRGNYWGSYWIAPTISFEVAAIANFVIAYFFVWKERISHRNTRSFFRHLAGYNAACVGAYILKVFAMQGFHFLFLSLGWMQQLTIEPVVCNLAGLCFSGGFNFVMSEFVIFNKKKKNTDLIHNI